jgi:peptidoglycan/xylan/chitin deacetylase (PgdA/CDA1 family)
LILLSFDIEEFDLPSEHNVALPLEEQIMYSKEGTRIILDLLEKYQLKATFFCTAVFALHARGLVKEIIDNGHELASHGYSHSSFANDDLKRSKQVLEEISGKAVKGYRMARMMKTEMQSVSEAGYLYDSSVNPTFIPGRYNNLNVSRTCYFDKGVLEIPASVSPLIRFPLFWLSMHTLPLSFYNFLCRQTIKKDGYLNVYFHSWEPSSHLQDKKLRIPLMIRRNSGQKFLLRLERFIKYFIARGETFMTISEFMVKYEGSVGGVEGLKG